MSGRQRGADECPDMAHVPLGVAVVTPSFQFFHDLPVALVTSESQVPEIRMWTTLGSQGRVLFCLLR